MAYTSSSHRAKVYYPDSRTLSAVEFLVGASIVIAYNIFHVIPNEVPILFVLGLLSVRLRNGGLSAMGFKRPTSWARLVVGNVGYVMDGPGRATTVAGLYHRSQTKSLRVCAA